MHPEIRNNINIDIDRDIFVNMKDINNIRKDNKKHIGKMKKNKKRETKIVNNVH